MTGNGKGNDRPANWVPNMWNFLKAENNVLNDMTFILLVTLPRSGSTAMADYLAQSVQAIGLTKTYEGQWLLKETSGPDRWSPNKKVSIRKLRKAWSKAAIAAQQDRNSKVDYVIEKSPSNMVRIKQVMEAFPNFRAVCGNRNPYALVSSDIYRSTVHSLAGEERQDRIVEFCERYLLRSECVARLAKEHDFPVCTYERFCSDPKVLLRTLELEEVAHEEILVSVKDYPKSEIVNKNNEQTNRLDAKDIETIRSVLSQSKGTLDYFGYSLNHEE